VKLDFNEERHKCAKIENLIEKYLGALHLEILPENELSDCIRIFVDKEDKDCIDKY
jgi:hypothetical protein